MVLSNTIVNLDIDAWENMKYKYPSRYWNFITKRTMFFNNIINSIQKETK